jgi:multidrug efflux pump subunit AcrB
MRARASGDFRISVTLTSPDGPLVLASGQLTVRSMSTSAVSIALSILAALVLLAWWGRTLWRRRRRRHPAHALGARAATRAAP